MAEDDERRREERIPINDEFGRSAAGENWVSDLSLGGVFVHTEELLPVGSMIELRFTILIDDPVVIEAFGKVVRHSHKPHGMGVEFAAMRPEMQLRIEDVLAHRRPLDSGTPLRLPEPSEPKPKPELADEDTTTDRVLFARPAPVEGLGLRRMQKQEFEEAVTASFPKVEQVKTTRFKPPPSPQAPARPSSRPEPRARETKEEDRTAVYRAVPRDDE
ncbi:MAG TPA: PilZ domain-containing protein [Enhygromyxa sp.]|nr:PilZ domain-containing protein [Enhygromyxa sp.]